MNLDDLKTRAQRVLDRCPRPPMELPADDPMRLLYECVNGGAVSDLENKLDDALAEAEDSNDEAAHADARREKAEAELVTMRDGLAKAAERAEEIRASDGDTATLDQLLADIGELENA